MQTQQKGHRDLEQLDLPHVSNNVFGEARMVLPGIQALFGFQLMAVFNNGFTSAAQVLQNLHYVALLMTIVATAFIMAPAAFDRMTKPYELSRKFIQISSRLITVGMIPLMVSIALDLYVVGKVITGDTILAAALAVAEAVLMVGLWFVMPKVWQKD
jgi:hypothetical protein